MQTPEVGWGFEGTLGSLIGLLVEGLWQPLRWMELKSHVNTGRQGHSVNHRVWALSLLLGYSSLLGLWKWKFQTSSETTYSFPPLIQFRIVSQVSYLLLSPWLLFIDIRPQTEMCPNVSTLPESVRALQRQCCLLLSTPTLLRSLLASYSDFSKKAGTVGLG
jgi:hypothetical protein